LPVQEGDVSPGSVWLVDEGGSNSGTYLDGRLNLDILPSDLGGLIFFPGKQNAKHQCEGSWA